jgi:hypothetical protein
VLGVTFRIFTEDVLRLGQAQCRVDARQQFAGTDVAGDEVGGAERAGARIGLLIVAGDHQHRNLTQAGQPRRAQSRQQTVAIQYRH